MLFPCQYHSWEAWPGQGKAVLMVLNKLPWVPVMLWQQELAPGFASSQHVGQEPPELEGCSVPVPCWLGQGLSALRLWLSAGEAALDGPSGWEGVTQETPLWDSPELWLLHLFHTSECDFPDTHFAVLLDCCFTLLELRVSLPQDSAWAAKASQLTWTLAHRKMSLTSPSTALQDRCILSELANQIEFLSPAQVIRRFCC